jgi:hypothetical protein
MTHDREWWRQALLSILIGACVAFGTALIEGLRDLMSGYLTNIAGGVTTTALLMKSVRRHV